MSGRLLGGKTIGGMGSHDRDRKSLGREIFIFISFN